MPYNLLNKDLFHFRMQPIYFLEITANGLYSYDIGPY